MKIISIRRGFECDHSSSNYEFFASERPLTAAQRRNAAGYSSRSSPGTRKATYQYHGDWSDLPSEAEDDLLTNGFDILVSESYDWWHFAVSFVYDKVLFSKLKGYEVTGPDDTGVTVEKKGSHILVHIHCMIEYDEFSPKVFETGIEEEEEDESAVDVDFSEYTNLMTALKREILAGDFSSLQAVVEFYDPNRTSQGKYTKVGRKLKSILASH